MFRFPARTGLIVLMATTGAVVAQSSLPGLTPTLVLAEFPVCAQPCALSVVQSAGCSLTDLASMTLCFCTNVTAQSELSTCAQINCDYYDAALSLYGENLFCEAYPKESRVWQIQAVTITTFVLGTLVILARCAARWKLTNRIWADDILCLVATVFTLLLAAIQLVSSRLGFGLHIWNFDFNNYRTLQILDYTGELSYTLALVTVKLGILMLYLRIFRVGGARWFRRTVVGLIIFGSLHAVGYGFALIFQCWPVAAVWDKTITDAKCIDKGSVIFSAAILSIVEDFLLIFLPIPELRKLQVSSRKRIGVGLIFAIASLGTVASIVRLYYIINETKKTYDATWETVDVIIWSLIELFCAVVCSSLSALRPLVDPWISRVTTSLSRSKGGSKGSSKLTESSTANSTIAYSGPKKKRASYAMSVLAPTSVGGQWRELGDEPRLPDKVAMHSSQALVKSKDLETGIDPTPKGQPVDGSPSDSENDLILQGVSVTYNVNVWSNNRSDVEDGSELERSVAVNGTPITTVVSDVHQRLSKSIF